MNKLLLTAGLLSSISLAACMGVGTPGMSGASPGSGSDAMMAEANQFQASMASAQLNADRPGDLTLNCAALESELVTTMQDPAVQAGIANAGGAAKDAQDQVEKQRKKMTGMMAASMATGIISSFIPGGGYAAMAANNAMARTAAAGSAPMQQSMMQIMSSYSSIMPQMMRGQRLMTLAKDKNCAFMKSIDVPPLPTATPGEAYMAPTSAPGLIGAGVIGNGNAARNKSLR